jgi:integrase
MGQEIRQHGVTLRGSGYTVRIRQMKEGVVRELARARYPFVSTKEAATLPKDHPLRRANALALANAYALRESRAAKTARRPGEGREAEGTLHEWLLRYRDEALNLHPWEEPAKALKIQVTPRASAEHDKSQIRSIERIAGEEKDIAVMLKTPVAQLEEWQFDRLLALWSDGKAKPRTRRRLLSTFSAVWKHHAKHYKMKTPKPWAEIEIEGDGVKEKARALTERELEKAEQELYRLHPSTRAAIEFTRWTGARRAETARLRWEDIIWPGVKDALPLAFFKRTKAARGSYKERLTYLDAGAMKAVDDMKGGDDYPASGWIFPAPKSPDTHISGSTIYQGFVRCLKAAGVAHASPHHLRHTRATELSVFLELPQLMEQLGHDDVDSAKIYQHLAEQTGRTIREKGGRRVSAAEARSKEARAEILDSLTVEELEAKLAERMPARNKREGGRKKSKVSGESSPIKSKK